MADSREPEKKKPTILWADDEIFYTHLLTDLLELEGFVVLKATDASSALRLVEQIDGKIDLAILDVMMPAGPAIPELTAMGGYRSGLVLGRWMVKTYPHIPIIGYSLADEREVADWFEEYGAGFVSKRTNRYNLVKFVTRKLSQSGRLRIFVCHGHDEQAKDELVDYLENSLKLGVPIILREQASRGRSILEKFHDEASDVDIVFVLLTPDDEIRTGTDDHQVRRRARQNVIFEMGYFLAKLHPDKGRVILLHKGEVELPSDIFGLITIDITGGVQLADNYIRRELAKWV